MNILRKAYFSSTRILDTSLRLNIQEQILEGKNVKLIPLTLDHYHDLSKIALDPSIWEYFMVKVRTQQDLSNFIQEALNWKQAKTALPFVTMYKPNNQIVGSTRFANIDAINRRAEIGWTWISKEFQRSPVNTEAKYLMLKYAFENMGCIRVEFKTDENNHKSRNAISRIGAKFEGILRYHMIKDDGRTRNSAYYSILDDEWNEVKQNLEKMMTKSY